MTLTILGTRGSMPISAPNMVKYGGNTTCYLFETPEEAIIIDAGTGIMNLPDTGDRRISLLITHAHIDHIMALPMFLGQHSGKDITIYGQMRDDLTIRQQLDLYISEPLWPVTMDKYPCNLAFKDIPDLASFSIGDVSIGTMPSNHPGGSTIYRLDYNGESVVIATDFEHEMEASKRLADFSNNATLILYDAQYTPQEYDKCKGFGHSTYEQALELADKVNPPAILLIHHAPGHDDAFLDALQADINRLTTEKASVSPTGDTKTTQIRLARESQVITVNKNIIL